MPVHQAVADYLERHGIDHDVMDCDPELADTAKFCEAYGIPMENSANAILVASKKPPGLYALNVVLATTRLDVNGAVRKRLGARKVSFASAEDTLSKTDQEIGGVTVFALPDDIPIWVDRRVMDTDWVVVGAGTRTAKIKVDPSVFVDLEGFEVVDELAKRTFPA